MATNRAEQHHDSQLESEPNRNSMNGTAAVNGGAAEELKPVPEAMWRPIRRSDLKLGVKDRILFWLMVATMYGFSMLPDAVLYKLGVIAGGLVYRLDKRHIRIGMKNLSIAFPEKTEAERAAILKDRKSVV